MKIAVISTMLNEQHFLPLYLKCVTKFANEVILTDGGSKDNSIDIINEYKAKYTTKRVDLLVQPQIGDPYTEAWHQGDRLNELLDRCTCDYVVLLDIDEYVERSDVLAAVYSMQRHNRSLANFVHVPFWGDMHHIRISTPDDPRWFGNPIARIVNRKEWRYMSVDHHSAPEHITFCRTATAWTETVIETSCRLYNLHYGFGADGIKYNDNRSKDLGDNYFVAKRDVPDFTRTTGEFGYIAVRPYGGPWPEDLYPYLKTEGVSNACNR